MRVGILTFHCTRNYGAVLQTYALQYYIKSLGHDVEIIDYRPYSLRKENYIVPRNYFPTGGITYIERLPKFMFRILWNFIEFLKFRTINKFFDFSNCYFEINETDFFNYDICFFGSDQIWNTKITDGMDSAYWGNLNSIAPLKKIAYAASAGGDKTIFQSSSKINLFVNNFAAVSVRESDLAEDLKNLLNKNIPVVLDPTFLLSYQMWKDFAEVHSKKDKSSFLLVYRFFSDEYLDKKIGSLSLQLNIRVKSVMPSSPFKVFDMSTPQEFVQLFMSAACIVTTTFHGVVFSILSRRPFYVYLRGMEYENRIIEILQKCHLMNRIITSDSDIIFEDIDYNTVYDNLAEYVAFSKKFIEDAFLI